MISEQCDDLDPPVNGSISVDKSSNTFSAKYSCDEGFALSEGNNLRYCDPKLSSGQTQWLPSITPQCEGKIPNAS